MQEDLITNWKLACYIKYSKSVGSLAGERTGHALMGWFSALWLSLQQAGYTLLGWGHQALHYLNIAWNWTVGFVTHAYARLKHAVRRQ